MMIMEKKFCEALGCQVQSPALSYVLCQRKSVLWSLSAPFIKNKIKCILKTESTIKIKTNGQGKRSGVFGVVQITQRDSSSDRGCALSYMRPVSLLKNTPNRNFFFFKGSWQGHLSLFFFSFFLFFFF